MTVAHNEKLYRDFVLLTRIPATYSGVQRPTLLDAKVREMALRTITVKKKEGQNDA